MKQIPFDLDMLKLHYAEFSNRVALVRKNWAGI